MGVAEHPVLRIMPFYKAFVFKAWFVFARAREFPVMFVKKKNVKKEQELQPPLNNVYSRRFGVEIMLSPFIFLSWSLISCT
jgi:hypothetical protein